MTPAQTLAWLALEGWEPVIYYITLNSIGFMHREKNLSVWVNDDDGKVGSWEPLSKIKDADAGLDDPGLAVLPVSVTDPDTIVAMYDYIVENQL